jgi:putative acetyltransferase
MMVARQAVEPYEEPPPEEGDPRQVLHIDDVPIKIFQHDVDGEVQRRMRSLHRLTGLERQAVHWAQVERGRRSTVFHTHDRTDEWIFVLSGRGVARVGEEHFDVGPSDFLGHPAGGPPHVMEAIDELTYLVGGEIDARDVVSYPEAGLRRVGGQLEPLGAGIASGARVEFEIREERVDDAAQIREVQRLAFGQALESELVDALRTNGAMLLSLVAVSARRVVGHVAYSPVSVGNANGAALGPMAVLPAQQRRGIGRALIEEGNRKLEARGCPFVVVVGHPGYYPRFGFRRASEHGVVCEWDLPDDVFMLRVLDPDAMRELKGLAKYRTEFSSVA